MGVALSSHHSGAYAVRQNADINVTPFVDVMLVLLIIFMVALPVSTVSVKVDLPQSNAEPIKAQPPVIVSLQLSGQLYVGERPTTWHDMPAAIAVALGSSDTHQRIYLRADEGVQYRELMGVMNRLRAAGYGQIGLVGEEF